MRNKSKKLSKLERERFSILTERMDQCYMCGRKKEHLHEIYFGNKHRLLSMKYGCVVPLCSTCHNLVHNNIDFDRNLKIQCQKKFQEIYDEKFIDIFKRNYL